MPDLRLRVGGRDYAGWKTIRVTRGIECIAGSFELGVSDKWAGAGVAWPIREEDECSLLIGDAVLITGRVDSRSISYGPEEHAFSVSGRDRAGELVDCSAFLTTWEWLNTPILTVAKALLDPFGIPVYVQPGLALPAPLAKITVDPGDTAFDALERACRMAALLPISDGKGGVVLTRAGTSRARTALVEGENILTASADFDVGGRFRRYIVMGQNQGNEEWSGSAVSSVRGEATDPNVRRSARVLVVRGESNVTPEAAVRRAQWEAKVRAGRGDVVNVTVQGWKQADGALWPVNARVAVRSPTLGIDGEMLVSQVTYSLDESSGSLTKLALKRPDAFLPEPVVADTGRWKELAGVGKTK